VAGIVPNGLKTHYTKPNRQSMTYGQLVFKVIIFRQRKDHMV